MLTLNHFTMDKYHLTLNDVLNNRFSIICKEVSTYIINDISQKEKLDTGKNDHQLQSDYDKYMMDLLDILFNMQECLSSIDHAYIFMRHFYSKEHFEKYEISTIDYYLYHYDVLCYKISTLKDLYFKLVNFLYDLKLEDKSCNWKAIEKRETIINNPFLFHLLRENHNNLSIIENQRNRSAHEGKVEHEAFKEISPYVLLTMYAETKFTNVDKELMITNGSYLESKLKKSQSIFFKEVEIYRYNSFIFTRCILCSLAEKFIQTINSKTKNKYLDIIKKAELQIQKNRTDKNCNINECSNNLKIKNGYTCSI